MRSGCNYFKNVIVIVEKIGANLFVCILTARRIRILGSMNIEGVTK
jgi:hypothetical protein